MRATNFFKLIILSSLFFCNFAFGQSGQIISNGGGGSGGVDGPVSSTDNEIPRFSGTSGDNLQGSDVLLDDNGFFIWPDSGSSIPASSYNIGRTSSGQLNFNAPTSSSQTFSFGGFVYMEISETNIEYLSSLGYQFQFDETQNHLLLSSSNSGSTGFDLKLRHTSGSPEDDDQIATIKYTFRNVSTPTYLDFGYIRSVARDVTSSTEDGEIEIHSISNGTMKKYIGFTDNASTFDSSIRVKNQVVSSATYNVDDDDTYIGVTRTSVGTATINLPTATGKDGMILIVNDEAFNAGTNNIIINASAGQNIDGASSKTLNINGVSVTIIARNSEWFLISQSKF